MATLIEDRIGGGGGLGIGGGDGMGVLLGLLLGRGGLLGNDNRDRDCVNQADLNGATLGDIKAAIPLAEAQVQLALAGNQNAISQLVTSIGNQLQNGQTAQLLQTCNQTAALTAAIAAVDTNVDRSSCDVKSAVKDSERNILEVINQNRIKDLEQQLTVSQLRESECRAINREQVNSHNVTTTVNTNQQQAQLQAQELRHSVNALLAGFSQIARATNSQVVVGSTGVAGTQTANPTNVAA